VVVSMALAADAISITIMDVTDNLTVVIWPGSEAGAWEQRSDAALALRDKQAPGASGGRPDRPQLCGRSRAGARG
jgi:hypothetical protein